MRSSLFELEHAEFRDLARDFYEKECCPHVSRWEKAGMVDREVWRKAGAVGMLGIDMPEQYGGMGLDDFRYKAIVVAQLYLTGAAGVGFGTHNNIVGPYLRNLTTEEQRARWLPKFVSGEMITALAISESDAGSDVASIRTHARRDGDGFVLNGAKTFITNGVLADLVVVAAKTDQGAGHRGISLLAVESGMDGFHRSGPLDKVGQRSRDTAELYFDDVRVPRKNLIGVENRGFYHLMENLAEERLTAAVIAVASMERALSLTTAQVRDRKLFGASLGAMQATRFTMAELHTDLLAAQAFVDSAIRALLDGELGGADAAAVKLWTTEAQSRVIDGCVQLFGGNGYMNDYEIARLWRDSRVQRIYAGSNEVMKEIIGRSLALDGPRS